MAKDTYNKRMKGHWTQGKSCKGDGEERQYSKLEIKQALKEAEDDYLIKHKGKRKKNHKASLEYRIAWYKAALEERKKIDRDEFSDWLWDGLKRAETEYAKKFGPKEKK